MLRMKHMMKSVDVNRGMGRNWIRLFQQSDVRIPEGWVHSLEISGRMVTFSFVRITGGHIADDTYILVSAKGDRNAALAGDGSWDASTRYYVLRVMDALRPTKEDDNSILGDGSAWAYLEEVAVASFTHSQKKQWEAEKKLAVC